MVSRNNFVCMARKGWIKNDLLFVQEMDEISNACYWSFSCTTVCKKHLGFWFFFESIVFWATHIDLRI